MLQLVMTDFGLTAYRIQIDSGIAKVKECIYIDNELHVKLSFEGLPIPLPEYITNSARCKLTSLDMLTNLPHFCKNYSASHNNCDIGVIKELLESTYYHPKGKPKYSSNALRFALLMRYTSHSTYQFLKHFLPLPSETLLTQLKSPSIQSSAALCGLRDNQLIGNDVVLLMDEMNQQQQVINVYFSI